MSRTIPIQIHQEGKPPKPFSLAEGVYTLGSDPGNHIVLPSESVAWRHAILSVGDDGLWVEGLGAAGTTKVNGEPIHGRMDLPPGAVLELGAYRITLGEVPESEAPRPSRKSGKEPVAKPAAVTSPSPVLSQTVQRENELKRSLKAQIHEELLERLDIKRLTTTHINETDLRDKVQAVLSELIREVKGKLPLGMRAEDLQKEVFDEALGLGPLEDLLADEDVTEIMVNGPDSLYIERAGKLEQVGVTFSSADAVLAVIERIVAPIGRRIDEKG